MEQDSNNVDLNYYLGICNIVLYNYQQALQNFQKIRSLSKAKSLTIDDLYYLAYLSHINHQFNEAQDIYKLLLSNMTTAGQESINLTDLNYYLTSNDIKKRIRQCDYAKMAVNDPINVKIERLSDAVNTKFPDKIPLISGDEKTLILLHSGQTIQAKDKRWFSL